MGTVTINSVPYTIYGTLAGAAEYLNATTHANAAWTAASTDNKARALVTATRQLDRQSWQGSKVADDQALAWPREDVTDRNGDEVDDSEIPDDLILASYELAYVVLSAPASQNTADTSSNIAEVYAKGAGARFFRPTEGTRFPVIIDELIGQYLAGAAAFAYALPVAGGTDTESDFDSCDEYGFTRGY